MLLAAAPFVGELVPDVDPIPDPESFPGGIYYVDPANVSGTALDSHTLLQAANVATAWRTLAGAVAAAPADSLVLMLSGTTVSTTLTTARVDWVTIRPAPATAVSIAGLRITNGAAHIAFEDFEGTSAIAAIVNITNGTSSSTGVCTCHHIALRRCHVSVPSGFTSTTVSVRYGASYIWIEDNEILGDPAPTAGAQVVVNLGASAPSATSALISHIYFRRNELHQGRDGDLLKIRRADDVWIEDNELYDLLRITPSSHCDMIQTELDGGSGLHILRNHLHNEMQPTSQAAAMLLTDCRIDGVEVVGNLIQDVGTSDQEISCAQMTNLVVANNTVDGTISIEGTATLDQQTELEACFNNVCGALHFDSSSGPLTVAVGAEGHNLSATWSGLTPDATSITGAATFEDAPAGDYRLAAASLGRGTGIATWNGASAPATDRLGAAFALDMGSDGRA